MSRDISHILREWKYDPDNAIRIILADDGHKVMQVRQPLGIEQYELDGRPDGKRPFGKPTVLDEIEGRLMKHQEKYDTDEGFKISHDEFVMLQNEGIMFYYRYLHLFQVGDYERTIRDTEHNLKICELAEKYCEKDDDPMVILQYRPYILRMNAISKAMISLHKNLKAMAQQILESAINSINEIPEIDSPTFQFEKARSLNYLKAALNQVKEKEEGPVDKLRKELEEAVAEEDYERAAQLRDRINDLTQE